MSVELAKHDIHNVPRSGFSKNKNKNKNKKPKKTNKIQK
jgi:hypothetical protein